MRELTVIPVPGPGAEDVLVGDEGHVWTGTADGAIFRISPDTHEAERVASTGGRPLGLEWLPDGRLLVCDARVGLLAVALGSGAIETLALSAAGEPLTVCNNAAVDTDGTIWFTDSTRHYPVERWKDDLIEDTQSGRLIRRDPNGRLDVVLDGLAYANGVALAADESFVAVAETGHRRIQRVWLKGPLTGQSEAFADDMPCYPDNIARGSDGLIWVTWSSPEDPLLTRLQRGPRWVRRAARRLPDSLKPEPQRTVRVAAFDDSGALVHDISADATHWHLPTGVREHDGTVWLGSLVEPAVACFNL